MLNINSKNFYMYLFHWYLSEMLSIRVIAAYTIKQRKFRIWEKLIEIQTSLKIDSKIVETVMNNFV